MKGKKILAAMLAVAMVLGGSMTAFAGNPNEEFPTEDNGSFTGKDDEWNDGVVGGGIEGEGGMAGSVDKNIFHVVLPVDNTDLIKSALNFKLDPQQLITKTNGEQIGNGSNFDPGRTLYFPNVTSGSSLIYWTDTSNHFTVTNKGSVEVDVSVDAELSNLKADGTITVTADKDFTNDTSTSMYMAIMTDNDVANGTNGAALTADADGAKATASITPAPIGAVSASAFKVQLKNDGSGDYEYVLDPAQSPTFQKISFWLKGAANENGDWDAFAREDKNPAPKLKLTWKVKPHTDSYASSSTIQATEAGRVVGYTAPSGVDPNKAVLTRPDGSTIELTGRLFTVNATDKRFAVKLTALQTNVGGSIAITYSDSHVDTLTITN